MTAFLRPNLNLIQKKEIHTRKELWKQKIKLLDLKKFDQDFWDKSYEFLPLPKTYQRIRDKVKAWIDANKEAEGKFLELQKQVGEELVKLAQIANGQREEEGREYEPGMAVDNTEAIGEVQRSIHGWLGRLQEDTTDEDVQRIAGAGLRLGRDNLRGFKKIPLALRRVSPELETAELEEYLAEWERLTVANLFAEEPRPPQPDLARLKELRKGALALQKNNWEQLEKQNNESIQSVEIGELINEWKEIKDNLREPCFILWHENNTLFFMWHNERGVDLGLERYGFLYRNKLYWVQNNAKLYVRVEAKVDLIYLYYGNLLRSSGTIKLKRAPLFLEDLDEPLAESNKLHYPFCDDKGNLDIWEDEGGYPSIQPRLKTMVLDLKDEIDTQRITMIKTGSDRWDPELPNQLNITDVSTAGGAMNWLSGFIGKTTGDQTLAFLAPADYPKIVNGKTFIQYISFSKVQGGDGTPENPGQGVPEEITLPDIFVKHPHLISESVVQVFFLNKMIHHGFLNQFHLEEKQDLNPEGRPRNKRIVLKFLNQIRANPSGIYYLMHSATQFWKAELSVSQVFKTQNLVQKIGEGVSNFFAKKDLFEITGLNDDVPDEKPKNEQNAKRTYTNTNKNSKNRPQITPDLLYPNTVDLKYDFLEFSNRYSKPLLMFRIQYSQDLLNNLRNCNNKSHEFDLDLTFAQLGVLINKPGEYQGELKLKEDINGFMKERFAKSVFFYEDLEKDLPNPDLKLLATKMQTIIPISDASIIVGDETMESATFTHQISYQADRKEYDHATWFCFSNGEVQESFKRACGCSFTHYYNNAPNTTRTGWCWGCTHDDLMRSNFLATSFIPQRDCQFVYCLEVGVTPTVRELQGGTNYHFTFTSTDILISWSVYSRTTEAIDPPSIDRDAMQHQPQSDQQEEIPDLSDLEENEDEGEVSEGEQQEEEETESESSDDEEEVEESEDENEDEEDETEESGEESEDEEEENSEDDEYEEDSEESQEE